MLALHHALMPSYRVLVWNRHAGLVLAVNAAIAWTAHPACTSSPTWPPPARRARPARITLGTRLQFLAAQTDVSGVWAAPRRTRMTVYLAGMGIDVCSVGICLLILILAGPHGLVRDLLAVAVAETLLALPTQFMVFMRTDLYFVLQDLTGCANLYADGSAYVRHIGRRIIERAGHGDRTNPDPSREYPRPQRRAVRVYSVVLLFGTAICLGVECAVSLPALVALLVRAVSEIGGPLVGTLDGSVALAILLAWQAIWSTSWWRRHQHQVKSMARNYLAAAGGEATTRTRRRHLTE